MIPLRLTLHDFLSYRSVDLDLSGIHTACICGANGAGKSALLEALSWGIWGQSRAANDQDLIRKGSTTARVTVVYRSQEQIYRVMRTRALGGGISLEWQIQTEQQETGQGWRSLTRRGVKATQLGIQQQLRLDYETFINSAYLRQGKADEFTLKRAGERKQILADILKLSQYDDLAERCREQVKQYRTAADQLQGKLDQLQHHQTHQTQLEQQYAQLQHSRIEGEATLATTQAELEQIRQRRQERNRLQERYQDLTQQSQTIGTTLQNTETQWRQQRDRLHQMESLLSQKDQIQLGCQHYQQLLQQDQQLNQAFERYQSLSQQQRSLQAQHLQQQQDYQTQQGSLRQKLQLLQATAQADQVLLQDRERIQEALQSLHRARTALQSWDQRQHQATPLLAKREQLRQQQQQQHSQLIARQALLTQQITQLEQTAEEQQVRQAVGILEADLAVLQERWDYRDLVIEKLQQRRLFVENLQERQRVLQQQWQQVDERRRLLEGSQDQVCPLCQQSLSGGLHSQVLTRQSEEQEELETELFVMREQLAVADRELELLEREKQALDRQLQDFDQRQQQKGRLQQQLETQQQAQQQLLEWQSQLQHIIQDLEHLEIRDPDHPLTQVEADLASIGYSDKDHALCRSEVERWRWAEGRWAEWQRVQARQQANQQQMHALEQQIAALAQAYQQQQSGADGILSRLATLEAALAELNYNPHQHHHLRGQLTAAQGWIQRWHDLQQAAHQHPTLEAQTQALLAALQQQRQHLSQSNQQLAAIHQQLSGIPSVAPVEMQHKEQLLARQRHELDGILAQIGAVQERRQTLTQLQQQQESLSQEIQSTRRQLQIYQELATAYGPNGIPAMIIENVLPELEAEANRILGRLTHHQLHLHFATQRAGRRTDKMIDTLDILIADPRGTRPYETYSGGEAFRINFAIRLALSQLLARRSGSRLQTLMIDEGFGTQDQAGRDQLVSAINTIAADFACILVITHIPSLQDAFSQRIEVERTPQGSQIHRVG
ncbi:MAG: SMC family ATPase [Synechococcaceae cyanobacterium SM2_3_2]|nr:SMC family ATPase [Synechococcaceae cyanobacterium SM2_3_2]